MPWTWALVFGISFVLGLAISAMAYQGFRVPYDLKSLKSVVFFVFISFIASIASSMGAFIWSFSHQLSAFDTLIIWKSWWSGTFLQSILFTGPLLLLGSKRIERAKQQWVTLDKRREVSIGWVFGAVSAIAGALALFILSGRYLGKMRVEEVMTSGTFATLPDVLGALESFEIITWISIGIIVVTGYGAMTLIRGWNAKLQDEVEKQTHELNQSREALAESLEEKELLINAFKHAFSGRENGIIDLNGSCEGRHVTITLADDGVGFTEEEQEMVSRSLGMMLIKKLTKQLRGTLDIDSIEQRGTSISLCFPLD